MSIAIKLFNSAGKLARTEKLWQEKLINVRMHFLLPSYFIFLFCFQQHYKSSDLQYLASQFDLGLKAMNIILEGLAPLMFNWKHFQIILSEKLHSFTMIRSDIFH